MRREFRKYGKYNCIKRRLSSKSGMTLTEMLAAVLILAMTAVAMGGGVVAVKDACRKIQEKSEAQQVLASTAQLLTDELSGAMEEKDGGTDGWDFQSGQNGAWLHLVSDPQLGICRVYETGGTDETVVPLLSSAAMGNLFYTDFDSYIYADGCFTVKDLAVYYKTEDGSRENRVAAASLDELTVRAANLEGR